MASNDKLIRIIIQARDEFSATMDKAAASTQAMGTKMRNVGAVMSATVTAPILAAGAAAAKTAIDFESAFAGVEKTVNGTAAEMDALNMQLRELATSADSPVSALQNSHAEIFAIAEAAGQLGVAREDIVGFTEVMAALGMTTNITGEEGARELAQFANVARVSLSDIGQLGDVIATLGNNLATTEAEILTFGQRMGTLSQLGFAADEILAIGGAMASAGINAELGSTNFVKGATEMQLAAAQGGAGLENLARTMNMSTAEAARFIEQNPAEAVLRFAEGLGRLPIEQQVAVLDSLNLSGSEAQRVFTVLAGDSERLAQALNLAGDAAQGNGALMAEAGTRAQTTQSQMNLLANNVRELGAAFGEVLLPALNNIITAILPVVQAFARLPDGVKTAIVVVLALVAAIAPLLMMIGQIMVMLPAITGAFTAIGGIIAGISAPVLALVAAVALLIFMIAKFGNTARTTFTQLVTIIAMSYQKFFQVVGQMIAAIGQFILKALGLQDAAGQIGAAFRSLGSAVGAGIMATIRFIGRAAEAIREFFSDVDSLQDLIVKIGEMFSKLGIIIVKSLISAVKKYGTELVKAMYDMAKRAADGIRRALKIRSPSKVMMEIGQQVTAGFQGGMGDGMTIPNPTLPTAPALATAGGGGGNVYINTLNVPPGTTQDQVDAIMRELGRRVQQRGGRGTR